MHTLVIHSLFFGVGIIQDLLITSYYQMIARERALQASLLSTTVTLVNILVLYEILSGIERQVLTVILAYAIGNGVGTFIVMKQHALRRVFARGR